MAFPTTVPAEGSVHTEAGEQFVVKHGRWAKRPPVRYSVLDKKNSAAPVLNIDIDKGTSRLVIHTSFHMRNDGHLRFNVTRNNAWLGPGDYEHIAGSLSSGGSNWRKSDWKTAFPPDLGGFWLNWKYDDWKAGNNQRGYCQISINEVNQDGFSVWQWLLFYNKLNQYPCRTLGMGYIKAHPSEIDIFTFKTDSNFGEVSIIAEAY